MHDVLGSSRVALVTGGAVRIGRAIVIAPLNLELSAVTAPSVTCATFVFAGTETGRAIS